MPKKIVKKVVRAEKEKKIVKIEVSRVINDDNVIITFNDGSEEKRAM